MKSLLMNSGEGSNHKFRLAQLKITRMGETPRTKRSYGHVIWKGVRKSALKGVVNWRLKKTQQIYKVSTPCLDDHNLKEEELESVGDMSQNGQELVTSAWLV